MKRYLPAALLLLLVPCCSPSDDRAVLKETYYFARTLGSDTTSFADFEKEMKSDTAAWAGARRTWKGTRVALSATLGELGYGTGPFRWQYGTREKAALSQFQRDLGIQATGQLDSLTVANLARAGNALRINDVVLPDLLVNQIDYMIFARGTWKAISNKLGYPVNTVDIECDAVRRVCNVVRVDFISEDLTQIAVHRNDFAIVQWSDGIVVARSGDNQNGATLTINLPAKEVLCTQVNSAVEFGGHRVMGPSTMTMRLVDGSKLSAPFDGGPDLKDVHEALFGNKERFLALRRKNMLLKD